MLITITLVTVWLLLMLRSCRAEFMYYHSIKIYEPEIWHKIGKPSMLKMPVVFMSNKNQQMLNEITHDKVMKLKKSYRQKGIQFLTYVVLTLSFGIIYFKLA